MSSASKDLVTKSRLSLDLNPFVIGFICGQLAFGVLLLVLIRVFFLRNGNEALLEVNKRRKPSQRTLLNLRATPSGETGNADAKRKLASTPAPATSTGAIGAFLLSLSDAVVLEKAYCPPTSLSPGAESCGWINLLLVQTMSVFRNDPRFQNRLLGVIDAHLNGFRKPNFVGPVMVTELNLGTEYPKILGAAVREYSSQKNVPTSSQNLCIEIDFEYADALDLTIDTQVIINWPRAYSASLPVTLTVSVRKIVGSLIIKHNLPEKYGPMTAFTDVNSKDYVSSSLSIAVAPDTFSISIDIQTMLGNRTKVKDFHHLNKYIASSIEKMVVDAFVKPSQRKIYIPNPLSGIPNLGTTQDVKED